MTLIENFWSFAGSVEVLSRNCRLSALLLLWDLVGRQIYSFPSPWLDIKSSTRRISTPRGKGKWGMNEPSTGYKNVTSTEFLLYFSKALLHFSVYFSELTQAKRKMIKSQKRHELAWSYRGKSFGVDSLKDGEQEWLGSGREVPPLQRAQERSAKISTLMRQSKAPENKQGLTERVVGGNHNRQMTRNAFLLASHLTVFTGQFFFWETVKHLDSNSSLRV